MCILCVIQKWSRRVATMLPWLVIPLIGLWLLSQFFPPAFRFEITSPRLACVLVLLVTLFWYEILMPQLSAWRVRRNARLFERKRSEAIEMQKLRKTATRRCRNCSTAYRDQNPSGGRFMCSHCGRISKRPILDLSVPPGFERLSNSGFFSNWICGQDWLENGSNWANTSLPGKSSYLMKNGNGNDHFISEKSYSFPVVFVCKIFATIFLSIMWVLRKLFRVSLAEDDASTDDDIKGLAKKGENGVNCNESRGEKVRRKAEEKKQARLEKEQLEEEERKQREEVARLVEERRKLRDEKTETEKDRSKGSNNNEKREAERKRQERKKEKDRGSSKSNSDVDELEKRTSKEIEKNKKGEIERRDHHQKCSNVSASNNYRGSVGTRYLDHMKGNFFSSSRTITESGLFGKGTNANTSKTREHRSSVSLDHPQITVNKRDLIQPERAHGNSTVHADDRSLNRPVVLESQPYPAPKRSWQQLFTRSSTNTNVISRPNEKSQAEAQISSTQGFNNPITFGLNSLPNFALGNATNPIFPQESDNFEDLSYVPDPASLIGPVSESLDNFQLDLGFEKKHNMPAVSPIESPVSRLRVSDETRVHSFLFPSNPRTQEDDNGAVNEKEWQMWNSSPIYQDTWCLPADLNALNTKEVEGTNNQYQPFNGSVWAKKEKGAPVSVEGIGSTSSLIPPVGGLYSTPDVHSLWSY